MQSPSTYVSRGFVAAAVVLTAVLFLPSSNDPINPVKLTALLLCAIGAAAAAATAVVRDRIIRMPPLWTLALGGALLLAFIVSALSAPLGGVAVLGTYGRNSGLLAYGAATLLFLLSLLVFDRSSIRVIAAAFIGAGAFTASYGVLQNFGIDAIAWANEFDPVIAALGNPNFAAAYLAICTPPAVWAALTSTLPIWARIAGGVTAFACLTANLMASAYQGPVAAAGGLFIVAVAVALNAPRRLRSPALAVLTGGAVVGVAALLAGAAGAGPATRVFENGSFAARQWYYQAALDMFQDQPLTGVGLDMFGTFWYQYRPIEAFYGLGGTAFSDAAHSVPLQMLAQGGILLGASYAALVVLVAWRLVVGLLRLDGPDRLLLGGLGGAWFAYQVQSLVSIDQVPLITAHFVLAAAVIVASGITTTERRLAGAPAPVPVGRSAKSKRRPVAVAPRVRPLNGTDMTVLTVVIVVALVASWQALRPVRADMAVVAGARELRQGNGNAALEQYDKAVDLAPSVAKYYGFKAMLLDQVQQPQLADQVRRASIEAGAYDVNALRQIAALEERSGNLDRARELYERVHELDPTTPEAIVAVATFELRHGGAARAREILEEAVVTLPREASLWATLGDARLVLGDQAGARAAYEKALEIVPDQPVATEGLTKLAPRR